MDWTASHYFLRLARVAALKQMQGDFALQTGTIGLVSSFQTSLQGTLQDASLIISVKKCPAEEMALVLFSMHHLNPLLPLLDSQEQRSNQPLTGHCAI